MIPNGSAYENFPPFANSGTKTPPGGSTESAKYSLGMVPADTFPAEWANYLFHGATQGITRLNADAGSMKKEINNVLSEAAITPDATVNTQLFQALRTLINNARKTVTVTTAANAAPSATGVPLINSYIDGMEISVTFTNGCWDQNNDTLTLNINNLGAKKIQALRDGETLNIPYHVTGRGTALRKWFLQENTILDLIYNATTDSGNGAWIVKGNPVVLSQYQANRYSIRANGIIDGGDVGDLKMSALIGEPYGWMECDGRWLDKFDYSVLYSYFSQTITVGGVTKKLSEIYGENSEQFRLPDYREVALVGVGQNAIDTIAAHDVYTMGEFKDDALQGHYHNATVRSYVSSSSAGSRGLDELHGTYSDSNISVTGPKTDGSHGTPRITSVTRGKRKGVKILIKVM